MSKFIYQCKPMHELRSLLQEATLTELRDVLSLGNVRGRSKLNREGLEDAAYKMLTEPYVIGYLVMTFVNASAWSVVERALCEREVTLGAEDDDTVLEMAEALYLADRSMLVKVYSWKGKLIAVSPKEVKAAYRKANEDNIQSQEKWAQVSLDHIAAACANFYGVVCRDEFDKYVAAYASEALKEYQNGYANEQAYKDAQRELLDTISVLSDEYVVDDEYIASTAFEGHSQDGDVPKIDHESAESVIQSRQSKKVFMPSAEEFLRYVRSDYYEHTPQTEALRAHLKRITGEKLRADEIDEILLDIHWAALCNRENVSAVITDVTERLEKHDVSLNLNAMNRLLGFITDMQNNTRLWDNYGNTPEELMKSSDYQPRAIRFGPGMMDAFKDGDDMNPDELLRKVNDIPFPNKEMRDSFIQQVFSAKKEVETSVPMSTGKIGRNQPCPCGSGKKYKNCCGKNK